MEKYLIIDEAGNNIAVITKLSDLNEAVESHFCEAVDYITMYPDRIFTHNVGFTEGHNIWVKLEKIHVYN